MIVDDIMPPFLKPFFLLGAKTFERMARGAARGGAKRGGAAGRAPPRNDADEAIDDARAEIEDTTAVLDAGASAGESAGAAAGELPPALLKRRLDKAKADADKAIKEKEVMQKKLDEMRAELALAKSNVGDVVQVAENPVATPARKVCLVPLETGFDLALNLDLCVIYLIRIFRRGRGRKRWQLPQFIVYPFLRKAASSLSSQVLARPTFVIFKKC